MADVLSLNCSDVARELRAEVPGVVDPSALPVAPGDAEAASRDDALASKLASESGGYSPGQKGAATRARAEHAIWLERRAALMQEKRSRLAKSDLDPGLTEFGKARDREDVEKEFAERQQVELAPIAERVNSLLSAREAAAQYLAAGTPDEQPKLTPEQRDLAELKRKMDVLALAVGLAGMTPKEVADAIAQRIQMGDPSTPDLLEFAAVRCAKDPLYAQQLAQIARAHSRERAISALQSSPLRRAAVAELAMLRHARFRIEEERRFYAANPYDKAPIVRRGGFDE